MNQFNFCENLRVIRKLKRKTQKQIATFSGLSQSYISELELGIKSPTLTTIEKIANALKVSTLELLF